MKIIEMTRGYKALVDDSDYARVICAGPWYPMKSKNTVYAQRRYRKAGKWHTQVMHRFILGTVSRKVFIDHRDRDGLNNQRDNIRPSTPSQNGHNSIKPSTGRALSQFKGVSGPRKGHGTRWRARIRVAGVPHFLGSFSTESEAKKAYDEAANKHFGPFARAIRAQLTVAEKQLRGTHQKSKDVNRPLPEIRQEIEECQASLADMRFNLHAAGSAIRREGVLIDVITRNNGGQEVRTKKLNPACKLQREMLTSIKSAKRALVLLREEELIAERTEKPEQDGFEGLDD